LLAVAAVLATGTRAVVVGLAVAVLAVLLRLALIKRSQIKLHLFRRSVDVRKLSIVLLLLITVFSSVFVSTRSNSVWQGVPGLDRLAGISATDPATQSRLINIGISLNAANPANVGIMRSLIGWGLEGYANAHNEFYNPSIQKYEVPWFDRAHNKLLDVLVMNGVLGLVAYFFLWGLLLRKAFSTKLKENYEGPNKELWVSLAIGGTAVAYFVQNLFFFDTIAGYIPLFTLFAFGTYTYYVRDMESQDKNVGVSRLSTPVKLGSAVLGALLIALFIWTSVTPIYQMRTMFGRLRQEQLDTDDIRRVTTPNNFIQSEVRPVLLFSALDLLPKENLIEVLPQMLELGEEALTRADNRARREQELGAIYNSAFKVYENDGYLARGEEHLREAVRLAPGRQGTAFVLVENLTLQGRFDELREIMDAARAAEPEGVNIDLFYFSYLAPSDFDGEFEVLDKLKDFYMGEDRASNDENTSYTMETYIYSVSYARRSRDGVRLRVLNDSQIIYIRESYSNHIHYAHRVGDEELLRQILLRTIEIEKTLREIVDFQAENGIIPKSIDTREDAFAQALATLDEHGLEAIRLR